MSDSHHLCAPVNHDIEISRLVVMLAFYGPGGP
jgi:hypothetical protein